MRCTDCRVVVSDDVHDEHMRILDRLYADEVAGVDNLLVHSRPAEDERDQDDMTVQCDRHFVYELANNLEAVRR